MPTSPVPTVALAFALLVGPGCFDNRPQGTSSMITPGMATYNSHRGGVAATLRIEPPSPVVGETVRLVLEGRDDKGGALLLSAAYDGRRPEDEGASPPDDCAAARPAVRSEESRTEERTFERAGSYEVRLLVVTMRCDESRAEVQAKATLVVRAA